MRAITLPTTGLASEGVTPSIPTLRKFPRPKETKQTADPLASLIESVRRLAQSTPTPTEEAKISAPPAPRQRPQPTVYQRLERWFD